MRAIAAFFLGLFLIGSATAQPMAGFADLNDALSPAVVNISTAQRVNRDDSMPVFPPGSPLERFNDLLGDGGPRIAESLGSGFIIDSEGLVVTNHHVIDEADEVEVILKDGTVLPAEIVGRDPATDLAVLRVESDADLPSVSFGDSEAARVGDWVVAIGNPFGFGGSLTAGVISARGREIGGQYDDYIQSDVAINRGNSGGPLFNLAGEVIGVNTAIFSPTGTSVGISFSVPSAVAEPVIAQLLEFGETRRGWLGVNVQPVTADMAEAMGLESADGAIVTRVDEDGPAATGGVEIGDVIVAFDDQPVPDDRALPIIVAETEPGRTVEIDVIRRGEPVSLDVRIERLEEDGAPERPASAGSDADAAEPEATSPSVFGLTLSVIDDALRRQYRLHPDADGLVVTAIDADSDAVGKVRVGDVVQEIAWTSVSSLDQALELVSDAGDRPVLFRLNRQGQTVIQTLRR